jgi:hypothetical protein
MTIGLVSGQPLPQLSAGALAKGAAAWKCAGVRAGLRYSVWSVEHFRNLRRLFMRCAKWLFLQEKATANPLFEGTITLVSL